MGTRGTWGGHKITAYRSSEEIKLGNVRNRVKVRTLLAKANEETEKITVVLMSSRNQSRAAKQNTAYLKSTRKKRL